MPLYLLSRGDFGLIPLLRGVAVFWPGCVIPTNLKYLWLALKKLLLLKSKELYSVRRVLIYSEKSKNEDVYAFLYFRSPELTIFVIIVSESLIFGGLAIGIGIAFYMGSRR